jgi:hypothetical protein
MVNKAYYPFGDNPLRDSVSSQISDLLSDLEAENQEYPRMSELGGTEEPRRKRRLSDSYFRVKGDEWIPQVVDDVTLPGLVLAGGAKVMGWGLREECIVRILFETGGRIHEVLSLSLGDWYARGLLREANAISKGSNGKRVKFLRWHDDTAKLLRRYFDSERRKCDPNGYGLENYLRLARCGAVQLLQVPLFLTERETQLSPKTFRQHYWNPACKSAGIDADPHQARHWYVTMAIRAIYESSQTEAEVQRRLRELVEYMKWKSGLAMVDVYQHYFDAQRHAEIQDRVHALLEQSKKQALVDLEQGRPKRQKPRSEEPGIPGRLATDADLTLLMDMIGGRPSDE